MAFDGLSFEEKSAWIMGLVTAGSYSTYLHVLLGRAEGVPLASVPYVATMIWTIGASIVASIVLIILVSIAAPTEAGKADQRDREIHRRGEYVGQWLVVTGGVVAMGMAMARIDHFWIANVLFLSFVLSTVLSTAAKIVAYRRGFQW